MPSADDVAGSGRAQRYVNQRPRRQVTTGSSGTQWQIVRFGDALPSEISGADTGTGGVERVRGQGGGALDSDAQPWAGAQFACLLHAESEQFVSVQRDHTSQGRDRDGQGIGRRARMPLAPAAAVESTQRCRTQWMIEPLVLDQGGAPITWGSRYRLKNESSGAWIRVRWDSTHGGLPPPVELTTVPDEATAVAFLPGARGGGAADDASDGVSVYEDEPGAGSMGTFSVGGSVGGGRSVAGSSPRRDRRDVVHIGLFVTAQDTAPRAWLHIAELAALAANMGVAGVGDTASGERSSRHEGAAETDAERSILMAGLMGHQGESSTPSGGAGGASRRRLSSDGLGSIRDVVETKHRGDGDSTGAQSDSTSQTLSDKESVHSWAADHADTGGDATGAGGGRAAWTSSKPATAPTPVSRTGQQLTCIMMPRKRHPPGGASWAATVHPPASTAFHLVPVSREASAGCRLVSRTVRALSHVVNANRLGPFHNVHAVRPPCPRACPAQPLLHCSVPAVRVTRMLTDVQVRTTTILLEDLERFATNSQHLAGGSAGLSDASDSTPLVARDAAPGRLELLTDNRVDSWACEVLRRWVHDAASVWWPRCS